MGDSVRFWSGLGKGLVGLAVGNERQRPKHPQVKRVNTGDIYTAGGDFDDSTAGSSYIGRPEGVFKPTTSISGSGGGHGTKWNAHYLAECEARCIGRKGGTSASAKDRRACKKWCG